MSLMSKKQLAAETINANQHLLCCPICHANIYYTNNESVTCINQHCFNISKRGYVNFYNKKTEVKYDSKMFQARRSLYYQNFLETIEEKITEIIINSSKYANNSNINILDAGCGEGYFLNKILSNIDSYITNPMGVGFDIAKSGIDLAARDYPGIIWLVADIANPPINNGEFDYIINLLSPANYLQFTRMLKPGGILIKIIPGTNYLQELRTLLYQEETTYSNEQVIQLFKENMQLEYTFKITDNLQLNDQLAKDLVTMTPLIWGKTEKLPSVDISQLQEITLDLDILVGYNK